MLNLRVMADEKDNAGKNLTEKEALELGQKLQQFYEMGYVDKKSALGFTFIKAVVQGVGVFIGGTVMVALLLWILSGLEDVPLIKPVRDALQTPTVQEDR